MNMQTVIKRTNSDDKDFAALVSLLDKELRERYGDIQSEYAKYNKIEQLPTVVIAYVNGQPSGCGCFKKYADDTVEIKRMFVNTGNRGMGIAYAILEELEKWARELQYKYAVLETAEKQQEAINLYYKAGYTLTENYGQYVNMPLSICFKKSLS
jgi:putative acetyltransferase